MSTPAENRLDFRALFSIDASSHLAKLAANYFPTPDHYAVELVRAALKNGASKVDLAIGPDRFEMRENSGPLDPLLREKISLLQERGLQAGRKEEIIASLMDGKGIGWLAIFALSPEKVEWAPGNRLRLRRRNPNWPGEIELLREHCRFATAELTINGDPIAGDKALAAAMVTLQLGPRPGMRSGRLWIPFGGDACRVWLLDQGIVWSQAAMPRWRGFVFEAAVEADGEVDEPFLERLQVDLRRLYRWLANHYTQYPDWARNRVDELFFSHFRQTADDAFLNRHAPFRLLKPARMLTCAEVKSFGRVYAVPTEEESDARGAAGGQNLFSLTGKQRDFLVNAAGISLVVVPPRCRRRGMWRRLGSWLSLRWRHLSSMLARLWLLLGPAADEGRDRLEASFLLALNRSLERQRKPGGGGAARALLVDWPCGMPLLRLDRPDGRRIYLCRRHRLVRLALKRFREDGDNGEWISAWIDG